MIKIFLYNFLISSDLSAIGSHFYVLPPSLEVKNKVTTEDEGEEMLEKRNKINLLQPAFNFLTVFLYPLPYSPHCLRPVLLRYVLTALSSKVLPHAAAPPAQQHVLPCAETSLQHSSTHLHQLHNGHKICQRDFAPDDKGLVLQKPLLKLLQRSGQPLHNLLELLRGQWLPREEGNQHLKREGT